MTSRLIALCIDANDPRLLARFWATALRWDVGEEVDGLVELVPTDSTTFRIEFAPVPEKKSSQNRIHLDLTTTSIDDQHETVARLLELGAQRIDIGQGADEAHVVLADPEGNEFCIIEPTNNFLSTCERLGAINCEGTQAVGYFWSKALGWPLVWDQNEETAIREPGATGPLITWSGPPVAPKLRKNRSHLDIAASDGGDRTTQLGEVDRLVSLGASRIDIGQGDVGWVVMTDPDGNEFCVLGPRPS